MTAAPPAIPLVDLGVQHAEIATEVAAGFADVIASSAFVGGRPVTEFEAEFAAFCGVEHCVGVANGTDAVELALRAAGIGPGDEVLVPANTFVATAEAVVRAGARVGFVDCDEKFLLIDPTDLARRIGPATRAVIGVDLFGQLAPMADLAAVARDAGLLLFEDAAQSQGASRDGRRAGSFGIAAATSFYPGKNLGAYGDAGAVLTSSPEVADAVRALRNHGAHQQYEHGSLGFNSRLDTLQAVVLRAKLGRLARWNEQRRSAAARYDALLDGWEEVECPRVASGNTHVWHLYVVQVARRDEVLAALRGMGIGAGVHYPTPVHLQPAFVSGGPGPGGCPVAERAATRILSLPLFPGITADQQERVVAALSSALGR